MLLMVVRKVESAGTSGLSQKVLAVLDQQWPVVIAVATGAALLAILFLWFFRRCPRNSPWGDRPLATPGRKHPGRKFGNRASEAENRFRNVFALTSEERRQALIGFYMRKHGCSREEAMVIAVEHRASDENRW
jgi:hypothetical protein